MDVRTVRRAMVLGALAGSLVLAGSVAAMASPQEHQNGDHDGMGGGGMMAPVTPTTRPPVTPPVTTHEQHHDAAEPQQQMEQHHEATDQEHPGEHHFGDVPGGAWYEECVRKMEQSGYMGGYPDGTFRPDGAMTRGQFAVIMARMMGTAATGGAPATPSFSDLSDYPAAEAIRALARLGVVNGRADGTFAPYDLITRAQMAAMMDRAYDCTHETDSDQSPQRDRAHDCTHVGDQERDQVRERLHDVAGCWAEDHIAHMYQLRVARGDEAGNFRPQETTTRAQGAAMLWRWHEVGTTAS